MRSKYLKDYETVIDLSLCEELLSKTQPAAYITGALLDNYAFINYDYKKHGGFMLVKKQNSKVVNRHLPRHYILIKEHFLTTQSSELIMLETDSKKKFNAFIKEAELSQDGEVYI